MRSPLGAAALWLAAAALGAGCSAATATQPSPAPQSASPAPPRPSSATPPPAAIDAPEPATLDAPAPAATATEPSPPPPAAPPAPRLYSRDQTTWIWPTPKRTGPFLGYVRVGRTVPLRSPELVKGEGCRAGYFQVAPRGFICNDATVTLTPEPWFERESADTLPSAGPFPYRYAISNGAPMYLRLPSPAEQKRREARYGKAGTWEPLPKTLRAHEELAVPEPIAPTDPLPSFLAPDAGRPKPLGLILQTIPVGSMLAYTKAFEAEGRTWLLSSDATLVPADRTRPFRPSAFHGVRLGGEVKLPLAWIRKEPRPQHRVTVSGAVERPGGAWPVRTSVGLTGASVEHAGVRYLETTDKDSSAAAPSSLYLAEQDATVVEAAEKVPLGVKPGQKWIVVRITQGTLTAYEGLTPVYSTLISPGKGGVLAKGEDPVDASKTPLGVYYVTFKDRAATMSPEKGLDRTFWIADVPHTQYFDPPFALHAAYWHERFGEPASAGCVNLSPIDAEAMFEWSDPPVPEGWQGATGAGAKENGPTTAVVIRR